MNSTAATAAPVKAVNLLAKYEQFNYGWSLCAADQPITRCTNVEQVRGYNSAAAGRNASEIVDFVFACGGNSVDADTALAGGW